MITDAFLAVVLTPLRWLLDGFPSVEWPAWFQTSGPGSVVAQMGTWGGHVGTIGGWFPVAELFDALDIVWVAAAAAAAVKIVRIVVSLFTAGGGSAA